MPASCCTQRCVGQQEGITPRSFKLTSLASKDMQPLCMETPTENPVGRCVLRRTTKGRWHHHSLEPHYLGCMFLILGLSCKTTSVCSKSLHVCCSQPVFLKLPWLHPQPHVLPSVPHMASKPQLSALLVCLSRSPQVLPLQKHRLVKLTQLFCSQHLAQVELTDHPKLLSLAGPTGPAVHVEVLRPLCQRLGPTEH